MSMQVIVGRFASYGAARHVIRSIEESDVRLEDYAVVTNNGDGNFTFEEGKDAGGKGFAYGALLTAGAGLFLDPIGWGAVAAGGLAGGLVRGSMTPTSPATASRLSARSCGSARAQRSP